MFVLRFRGQIFKIDSIYDDFTTVLNSFEGSDKPVEDLYGSQKRAQTETSHYKMKQPEELDDQFKINVDDVRQNDCVQI